MWDTLPIHWQACIQETWAAYRAGSIPIGAVVVNGAGEIIGRGRNSTKGASEQAISDHRLAHAEVNALLAADFRAHHPKDCILYASTEPCPLCTGAAVMANLKHVAFASRDPWAGGSDLLAASDYMRRQRVRVSPPQDQALEAVLVALQVEWHLQAEGQRAKPLVEAWRPLSPRGVAQGEALHASGELQALALEGSEAEAALALLASSL